MFDGQEFKKKVDEVFESVIEKVYRGRQRNIMAKMHKCAVNCYSEKDSLASAEACVSACQVPAMQASEIINICFQEYQSTLGNCLNAALDSTRYKNLSDSEKDRHLKSASDVCIQEFYKIKDTVAQDCINKLDKIKT